MSNSHERPDDTTPFPPPAMVVFPGDPSRERRRRSLRARYLHWEAVRSEAVATLAEILTDLEALCCAPECCEPGSHDVSELLTGRQAMPEVER